MTTTPRLSLWMLRCTGAALAVVMALAISSATDGRSGAADTVATIVWGVTVAVVALALVVPAPLSLAIVRMLIPATVPAAVAAVAYGANAPWGLTAIVLAVLATAIVLSAEAGEAMVQAAAYGAERRLPLRTPAALLVAIVVSWIVWCGLAMAGTLTLAASEWLLGAALTLAAVALGHLIVRRNQRLAMRWLVVVPAGLVVHDQLVLAETLMVPHSNVRGAQLALADTAAADLTGPAAGHALEVTVGEMVLAVLAATTQHPKGRALHVQSFLVAPSRPGRALQAVLGGSGTS